MVDNTINNGICPESNVSDLNCEATVRRSGWVEEEVSFRTRGRSVVSDHPESSDRLFRVTRFRLRCGAR